MFWINTTYSFDENGYVSQILDENGRVTQKINLCSDGSVNCYVDYEYDADGKQINEIWYDCDENGNITKLT